ncbi:FLYWCH zinc finger domain-containing protein [Phthorimaea operculella]|nr:FLYWCH zinc finger domain-containing protein [Phthorimaea operculella]
MMGEYRFKKRSKHTNQRQEIHWVCNKCDKGCKAKLTTLNDAIIKINNVHDHDGIRKVKDEKEVFFTKNRRGGENLWRAGFRHRLRRQNENGTSVWSCWRKPLCRASLTYDNVNKKIVRMTSVHTCAADYVAFEREKVHVDLRNAVRENTALSVRDAYDNYVETYKLLNPAYHAHFDAILPNYNTIKAVLFKDRIKHLKQNDENKTNDNGPDPTHFLNVTDYLICNAHFGDVDG